MRGVKVLWIFQDRIAGSLPLMYSFLDYLMYITPRVKYIFCLFKKEKFFRSFFFRSRKKNDIKHFDKKRLNLNKRKVKDSFRRLG